ncbi:MAG: hypothetical protein RL172_481 [Bacteroidota bacterium]
MQQQWKIFLSAIMFLTRLPVGRHMDHNEALLQQTPRYLPLVGCVVAMIVLPVFIIFYQWVSPSLAILAMMICSLLVTGAFHEDGFADVCDAFGGGWTKEKILLIMKDSRLGTYGVAGLVSILAAKFLLLQQLITLLNTTEDKIVFYRLFAGICLAAHSSSRLMSVWVIQLYQYVTADDGSKSKPLASQKLSPVGMCIAIAGAIAAFLLLPPNFLLVFFLQLPVTLLLANYFKKWIGGYTGDCLGAVQQVAEICFYLAAIIIWKYI